VADCQATIRHRVLRLFVRRGLLEADDAKLMGEWAHDGSFSLDASARIEVWDLAIQRRAQQLIQPLHALIH